MPPKSKNKGKTGVESSTTKKKGKTSKRQPSPAHTDMDNTTGGEEEPSMKCVMASVTAMNTRMDRFERSKDGGNSASVHTVYDVPPEPCTSRPPRQTQLRVRTLPCLMDMGNPTIMADGRKSGV